MNRAEAEDYIYESYLKAEKEWNFYDRDKNKRNPLFSKEVIQSIEMAPAIAVTGSKGKGSVAKMIERILSVKMTVGLMTSPHIVDFNERFCVSGFKISDDDFVRYVTEAKSLFAKVAEGLKQGECISPIGIQCVIALLFFRNQRTDMNVFEGGKGVRYDDVNNIPHEYAVINTIFLEHTRELGSSLTEIAQDKACIITGKEKSVYIAEQKNEVMEVLTGRAKQMNVQCKIYGRDFYEKNLRFDRTGMLFDVVVGNDTYTDICVPLLGEHQARNCALALAVCADIMDISDCIGLIRKQLRGLEWPGRMEILSDSPFVLLDACINRESAYNVIRILRELGLSRVTTIIGIPDDKDYFGVAEVMNEVSEQMILTKSTNPHYIFTDRQKKHLESICSQVVWTENVLSAIQLALQDRHAIVILGTTSLIADVKRIRIDELLTCKGRRGRF